MSECSIWQGDPRHYNEQALISLVDSGCRIWPWSWVNPTCGSDLCLEPDHLDVEGPRQLEYPRGVCVYCGVISQSQDHIIPTALTGIGLRKYVLTVPSCTQCNSAIGATVTHSITRRREIAHEFIKRKYCKALARPDYTEDEINEFEGLLRQSVIQAADEKRWVLARLEWPDDPSYDLRALQKSGIENPYVNGLISLPSSA